MKGLILACACFGLLAAGDPYQAERERMVRDQIQARGVHQPEVLQAIRSTLRHLFVPQPLRSQAYQDRPLPIGSGQTISQPYIVAFMTELLEPSKGQKVLEIGTGSGYQAAVLAALVGHVYTMEIVSGLARSAAALLKSLEVRNVTVRSGDGYRGWPEEAPFDRIILTAAPPEIPHALIDQLRPGGIMVAPVGSSPVMQRLVFIRKGPDGKIRTRSVIPVAFVPMVPQKR
jgi:protein-L-isoaspartate(D-aspartate) O-methyltransferase